MFSGEPYSVTCDVPSIKEQQAVARKAVSTTSPNLLAVFLEIARSIVMNHVPDILFVDPHSVSESCDELPG